MKDPVYCWANGKAYGDIIKVIVGNNRMAVAKELRIKMIPAVITNFKADKLPIEGRVLNGFSVFLHSSTIARICSRLADGTQIKISS